MQRILILDEEIVDIINGIVVRATSIQNGNSAKVVTKHPKGKIKGEVFMFQDCTGQEQKFSVKDLALSYAAGVRAGLDIIKEEWS